MMADELDREAPEEAQGPEQGDGGADAQSLALAEERGRIIAKASAASGSKELTDLTNMFNVNLTKAEMARASRQSELLDKVIEQVGIRLENAADTMSDRDLLGYMSAFQSGLERSRGAVDNGGSLIAPTLIVGRNEVKIDGLGMSRDSREKVAAAVKDVLMQAMRSAGSANAIDAEEADGDGKEDDGLQEPQKQD